MLVAAVVASFTCVEAASVTISWNAPTTNADGTALTDLSGYRIYLGTTAPSCPGASFHSVQSPSATPSAGQVLSTRITGLTGGTTYFARITAVDVAGNESACSTSASGVAQPDFSVTPSTTTGFGSVAVNGTVDRTFTVQNTSTASISGTASVGAPFSILSGGSFSLAAGASQVVTVRFRPTTAGTFAGNVNFTASGDTLSRAVSGSTSAVASVALTVTKNGTGSGTVTSSAPGIACGTDCSESMPVGTPVTLTATAASGSVFMGWSGACSGTAATCAWTMSAATAVTASFSRVDLPLDPGIPVISSLSPASATAGSPASTLTVNGSGFVAASVVRWNGANRTTTFVSATQLRAAITATDLATVRIVPVGVFTPAPGGGTSGTLSFVVAAPSAIPSAPNNPSVSLQTSDANGVTFSITWGAVAGAASYPYVAAFTDGSAAQQGAPTTASLQLRMPYHTSGAASSGFICIRSANAGGQQSADQSCNVLSVPARPVVSTPPPVPVPSASSLSPASAVAGSAGFTLTVNGSGFVASSVVRWNGAARTTTVVSATQLRANIAASDLVTSGQAAVSVFTPAPGGGTSAALNFTVTAPPVPTTPPPAPGNPSVTQVSADANGVTFAVTWGAVSGVTSYRYIAAFTDGSAFQQGSVTGLQSFQLRMPYHASGAALTAFVCVRSVSAAGQQSTDQSCNVMTVPARPR
jgi:Divergent InlB B-repeat domain/Cep192 domain 4